MQEIQSEYTQPNALRMHFYHDFIKGILLTVVLILIKTGIEHWEFGKQVEQMTYNMLQIRLLSRSAHENLPVVVVDINEIVPVPVKHADRTVLVTPRKPLLRIIKAIADQKPLAIGIDLDFSPNVYGYYSPEDPAFFKSLLNIRNQGIPVYLGIYDSVFYDPGKWLGQPEFQPLAAYITIPYPEDTEPSTKMIEWVQPAGVSEPCFSLSYALTRTERTPILKPLQWAVKRTALTAKDEFSVSEFLIDYAPLETLISQRIVAEDESAIAQYNKQIAGKIVLIGRASPELSLDQFNVPGRGVPVPGIYVHASAIYTLLQAPLYRLTPKGRVAADALAALLVFGPILLIQLYYSRKCINSVKSYNLPRILTLAVILAVIVVGHLLVHKIRIIWTDYLMVIGALLLHSPMERSLDKPSQWFRSNILKKWLLSILPKAPKKKGNDHENDG
jgi:CHASE2 domain-containing sensor protein